MTVVSYLFESLVYSGAGFMLGWMSAWALRDAHR